MSSGKDAVAHHPRVPPEEVQRIAMIGAVCTTIALCACGGLDGPGLVVADSAGVEVVTVQDLPSLDDSRFAWELETIRRVRTQPSMTSLPLVYDPDAALALSDGNLLLSDPMADRPLVIIDPDSENVVARFGLKGRGPGELSGRRSFGEAEDGTIWVANLVNRQVLRYSRSGELLGRLDVPIDVPPMELFVQQATGVLFARMFTQPANQVERIDVATGERKPILHLPRLDSHQAPGYGATGRPMWTVLNSGLVTNRSDRPVYRFYTSTGELVREIRLPLTQRTLTRADIQAQIRYFGDIATRLRPGPIAMTNYLYAVDDSIFGTLQGNLWRASEDPGIDFGRTIWRLVWVTGEYAGHLNLPDGMIPLTNGHQGRFWARVLDENGTPELREYQLVGPGTGR